ncbi:MAG: hypothetical protein MPJ50_02250 [Pirellulales bacterium]|nr:hypothetical protein [Pirellulales bacterium]
MRQFATMMPLVTFASCLLLLSALTASSPAQSRPRTTPPVTPPANAGSAQQGQSGGSNTRLRFLPPEQSTQDAAGDRRDSDAIRGSAATENNGAVVPATTSADLREESPRQSSVRPGIGTLRLRGIAPGQSTVDQLRAGWGEPLRTSEPEQGHFILEFEFPPFASANVSVINGTVVRVVLPMSQAMTVNEAIAALQLADVPPVIVPDEQGAPLGIAFPERGVLFNVAPSDANAVTQATIEPVSFHAFLLRAENLWHEDYSGALADVDTVLELDANQPQAHWIRAKLLHALGRTDEALRAIRQASTLAPETPEYLLTEAAILIHQGHLPLARDLAAQTVRISDQLPELKAQAMVFQGDLLRDDGPSGGRQAMDLHMQAIEAAKPIINDSRLAIRRAARNAYLDAHLSIAMDIAAGSFRNQADAVGQWLSRAMVLAEGAAETRRVEQKFHVASQGLHALARMPSPPDPQEWARQTLTLGRELLGDIADPLCQQRISWDLARALASGVKIHRKRGEAADALQLAELADTYFRQAGPDRGKSGREALQIGLFRFQAGSVEALLNDDHEAAAKWYETAKGSFAQTPTHLTERIDYEYGQILVSMAVSYWETGKPDQALQLMTDGSKYMEAAVQAGRLESKAMGAPYFNLAVMLRHLGKESEAVHYDELARRVGVETGPVR